MSYHYDTKHIKTLDKIKKDYDVKHIAHAFYPGLHCPLFTAVMTAMQIEDMYVLVAGTEECTYYSKNLASRTDKGRGRLYSFVLDKNDIAFGCGSKLADAVRDICNNENCRALLVISTCVTELIGEDFDAIIDGVQEELDTKILLVRTNHYKKDSPLEGIKETLISLVDLMDEQPANPCSVNILGHKFGRFDATELGRVLKSNDITINVKIPTKCDIQTVCKAPAAKLNIVTNFSALDLARKMKERFDIDYVYFEKYTSPGRIKNCYLQLQEKLGIDIGTFIDDMYDKTAQEMKDIKGIVQDRSFIFGMPPMFAYEITSFFCELGMKPLWFQALGLREDEAEFKGEIQKFANPKVFRALDIPFIEMLSEQEKPDYCFVGMGRPGKQKNSRNVELMKDVINGIGFEVPVNIIKRLREIENMRENNK